MNTTTKSKVEKMLNTDITNAKTALRYKREDELLALREKAINNPEKKIAALKEKAFKAHYEKEATEKALMEAGYSIQYVKQYNTEAGLHLSSNIDKADKPCEIAKDILAFNKETRDNEDKLDGLMRGYMIKIYANSTDMENLFKQMAEDIKKITG